MFLLILLVVLLQTAIPTAASESLAEALRGIESGRYKDALPTLETLANKGDAVAQLHLGRLYFDGRGIPENEMKAIFWWREAAAQGNTEAMFRLGSAYLFSTQAAQTVPDPDREAAIWYFQAASAGHAEAQYHLGLLFLSGKGVVADQREATRWLRKAAGQGLAQAKKTLAIVFAGR